MKETARAVLSWGAGDGGFADGAAGVFPESGGED